MGRKPNQLILEFFTRGSKLEDASNRYQYTCKACEEHFPKGRTEILASHLATQCKALSGEDRDRALIQLRQLPEQFESNQRGQHREDDLRPAESSAEVYVGQNVSRTKKFTGLEALAEASRQVEHSGPIADQEENVLDPSLKEAEIYDGLLRAESRVQNELAASLACDMDTLPALSSWDTASRSRYVSGESPSSPIAPPKNPDLPGIAASASNLEALLANAETSALDDGSDRPFDIYSELQALRSPTTWPSKRATTRRGEAKGLVTHLRKASTYPHVQDIETNGLSATKNHEQRVSRGQKIRGKFSDSRRKQVQEVRKRGACIRCRMLRKTCSDGDPCSTCASIESARLWKTPCMRTRIASELDLFSTGMYAMLAESEIRGLHEKYGQSTFTKYPGQIFVTHFPNSSIHMARSAIISNSPIGDEPIDGAIRPSETDTRVVLLDDVANDAMSDLATYTLAIGPLLHSQEQSPYMSATLSIASELSTARNDALLAQVLDLWTLTHLLLNTSPQWHILTASHPSTPLPHPTPIPAQLLALTEHRASTLSRRTAHALEKRLLHNPHSQTFETFLATLLLLSCVERMAWLYQTWASPSHSSRWPLPQLPAHYVHQAEAFAHLISMLLRMRGAVPKTAVCAQTGCLVPAGRGDEVVGRWFEEVRVTHAYLADRANAAFDAEDPRCWELRLAGRLFVA